MLACSRVTPTCTSGYRSRFSCRAEDQQTQNSTGLIVQNKKKKKVLVVGSGWAGLGAAYHLCKQVPHHSLSLYLSIYTSIYICMRINIS